MPSVRPLTTVRVTNKSWSMLKVIIYYRATMPHFYLPILHLVSDEPDFDIDAYPFCLVQRRWDVSTFDLATLATKHRLRISYQLMDVFLKACNLELRVEAETLAEVAELARGLRAMLYVNNVSPFVMPFIATHSINNYAGINSRDSDLLREKIHPDLQNGPTSTDINVEAWPFESILWLIGAGEDKLSRTTFITAIEQVKKWQEMSGKTKELQVVQDVLTTAPQILNQQQSVLHIWTGLEALFPSVQHEVTFRIALYLAQLCAGEQDRRELFQRAKSAYNTRSKIAHGSKGKFMPKDWYIAWDLLREVSQSILRRGMLPTENQLIEELLAAPVTTQS